jgi:hypothetical protein
VSARSAWHNLNERPLKINPTAVAGFMAAESGSRLFNGVRSYRQPISTSAPTNISAGPQSREKDVREEISR